MNYPLTYQILGWIVVVSPSLLVAVVGLTSISDRSLSERMISRITQTLVAIGLLASVGILVLMLTHGERSVTVTPWQWVSVGDESEGGELKRMSHPIETGVRADSQTTAGQMEQGSSFVDPPNEMTKQAGQLDGDELVILDNLLPSDAANDSAIIHKPPSQTPNVPAVEADPATAQAPAIGEGVGIEQLLLPTVAESIQESTAGDSTTEVPLIVEEEPSGLESILAPLVEDEPEEEFKHAHAHFHFEVKFVFDRLSVPFVLLTFILCSTIGAFARSYMHHEPGYRRFFVLYSIFLLGMIASALAGSIETLFAGWELVGLSSALLVAFYQNRPSPVQNGLRVWVVYRFADAAFLLAALTLHGLTGEGDFAGLMGNAPWPAGVASMTSHQALFVGALLLIAAAGKSALVPFSGWLPRAMEGPTPSSAIFYGSLSVHLGAYLLLRISPILALSTTLSVIVVVLGLTTAAYAALAGRVQTDIKSSLSFASMMQVGLIVAEIGCGWRYLALTHLLGHACLRTLQLVRAPSLLLDYQRIKDAVGTPAIDSEAASAHPGRLKLYRFAIERGYLDQALDSFLVRPFIVTFQKCNEWERRWTNWLSGVAESTTPPRTHSSSESVSSTLVSLASGRNGESAAGLATSEGNSESGNELDGTEVAS